MQRKHRTWALVTLAALAGVLGCEERPPPPEPPGRPALPERPRRPDGDADAVELPDGGDFDAAAEAKRLVAELRSAKLEVASRRVPIQRLVFGKDRLAQLIELRICPPAVRIVFMSDQTGQPHRLVFPRPAPLRIH